MLPEGVTPISYSFQESQDTLVKRVEQASCFVQPQLLWPLPRDSI